MEYVNQGPLLEMRQNDCGVTLYYKERKLTIDKKYRMFICSGEIETMKSPDLGCVVLGLKIAGRKIFERTPEEVRSRFYGVIGNEELRKRA